MNSAVTHIIMSNIVNSAVIATTPTIAGFGIVPILFYLAGLIAVVASIKVITGKNAIHALLYLIVSLLSVAVCFYFMGAPFAAGLEVIVYAGAILVLFVFAVMMFGLAEDETKHSPELSSGASGISVWIGPSLLAAVLLVELIYILNLSDSNQQMLSKVVDAKQVGALLYGPYMLAVEIASFLLLAGLVAGYHFAKPDNYRVRHELHKGEHL